MLKSKLRRECIWWWRLTCIIVVFEFSINYLSIFIYESTVGSVESEIVFLKFGSWKLKNGFDS